MIKLLQQMKNVQVFIDDIGKLFIFPEFISVSDFNVGITAVVIMVQRGDIEIFIPEEILPVASNPIPMI
jgi:hypothetical protein